MKTMKEYLSTPEGMKQMWEKVNEVLDNFDFSTVIIAMEALDWGWACTKEEASIYSDEGCKVKLDNIMDEPGVVEYFPQHKHLLKAARNLITECIDDMVENGEEEWAMSTGGFKARVRISTDEERADYYGAEVANVDDFEHSVDISLYFIIEESTSY